MVMALLVLNPKHSTVDGDGDDGDEEDDDACLGAAGEHHEGQGEVHGPPPAAPRAG